MAAAAAAQSGAPLFDMPMHRHDGAWTYFPRFATTGDFDGDGRTDVAMQTAEYLGWPIPQSAPGIRVLLNRGNGSFDTAVTTATDVGVGLAAADFDGDGSEDLATRLMDEVVILHGAGDGTFVRAASIPVEPAPGWVSAADLDVDGRPDVVVASKPNGTLTVLLAEGGGQFENHGSFQAGVGTDVLAMGDFNADAKPDVAVGNAATQRVTILLGDGAGSLAKVASWSVGGPPTQLCVADFNEDGRQDVAAAAGPAGVVTVLLGQGDGWFVPEGPVWAGSPCGGLAAGDFDQDGHLDLAAPWQTTPGRLVVLRGLGDGSFEAGEPSFIREFPGQLLADDFDGQGLTDLAIVHFDAEGCLSFAFGAGDGTFHANAGVVGGSPAALVSADLNADGRSDLVTPNMVFLAGPGGVLQPGLPLGPLSADELFLADCDEDEHLDLVAVNLGDKFKILAGRGDGTFDEAGAVTVPLEYGESAAVGDVNGDGHADVVAGFQVFLGTGDGGTAPGLELNVGSEDPAMAIGDFDGDGRADVAVAGHPPFTSGTVITPMFGVGDGTFVKGATVHINGGPSAMVAADINADGRSDVVVASSSGDSLAAYCGQADGSFVHTGTFANGGDAYGLVAKDFDGDGALDLAATTYLYDSVHVLTGDGSGSFTSNGVYVCGLNSRPLCSGDFDGDGFPDLAVGNWSFFSSPPITVLKNRGLSPAFAWTNLGHGLGGADGVPLLVGTGTLMDGSSGALALTGAAPSAPAALFGGLSGALVPFKGGTLIPMPLLFAIPIATSTGGAVTLPWSSWPGGLSGVTTYCQAAIKDSGAVAGVSLSNGVSGTVP